MKRAMWPDIPATSVGPVVTHCIGCPIPYPFARVAGIEPGGVDKKVYLTQCYRNVDSMDTSGTEYIRRGASTVTALGAFSSPPFRST